VRRVVCEEVRFDGRPAARGIRRGGQTGGKPDLRRVCCLRAHSSMRDDELAELDFDLESLARHEAGFFEPTA